MRNYAIKQTKTYYCIIFLAFYTMNCADNNTLFFFEKRVTVVFVLSFSTVTFVSLADYYNLIFIKLNTIVDILIATLKNNNANIVKTS